MPHCARLNETVGVDKNDDLMFRTLCTLCHAIPFPAIYREVDHLDSAHCSLDLVGNTMHSLKRSVRGTVIYHDDLDFLPRVFNRRKTAYRFFDIVFLVFCGYNECNTRLVG